MRYLKYLINGLHPRKFCYISALSFRGLLSRRYPAYDNEKHVKSAMEWMSHAQKQNNDGGVSAMYSLLEGWHPSYIETTGYIIPTFLNYAEASKNPVYKKEALEMADFELGSQLSSGAFPGGGKKDIPIVFNTGQVLFGLCRAYEETKEAKYGKAANKAADWLISVMDEDGSWKKYDYLNHVHTYNTRTSHALLCAYKASGNTEYQKAAEKNIDWALSQQLENGWLQNNGFYPEQEPLVHTIAYSIIGILEAAIHFRRKKYLDAAAKAATALMHAQRDDGSLPGSFDKDWKSSVKWSCLTGNSQMAIIWHKLFLATKKKEFLDAAKKANQYMRTMQDMSSLNPGIKGGIPGAFPIYGWYAPFCFPNWAAKFFVDALMLEKHPEMHAKMT